mmetsp:Transcript_8498/g.20894  ORF Transcript_8498/g.20894 Transcript_8498/m.20894 type:complete len:218 (-) Transcript_8498:277-930(-)
MCLHPHRPSWWETIAAVSLLPIIPTMTDSGRISWPLAWQRQQFPQKPNRLFTDQPGGTTRAAMAPGHHFSVPATSGNTRSRSPNWKSRRWQARRIHLLPRCPLPPTTLPAPTTNVLALATPAMPEQSETNPCRHPSSCPLRNSTSSLSRSRANLPSRGGWKPKLTTKTNTTKPPMTAANHPHPPRASTAAFWRRSCSFLPFGSRSNTNAGALSRRIA